MLELGIAASSDYYISRLIYYVPSATVNSEQTVKYDNLGLGIQFDIQYKYVAVWSKISVVQLKGGEIVQENTIWDSRGIPEFDHASISTGIGLVMSF
jgi:ABC-type uncharacterized transport system YnjBCD permease subunit